MSNENTQLTVIERAKVALESSKAVEWLRGLAGQFASITAITNKAGRDECHSAYMRLKDARLAVEKASKAAREDAVKFGKAVIAEEKELVSIVTPEEERLRALRDGWDREEDRKREELAESERIRIANIQGRIASISNAVVAASGKSSAVISEEIDVITSIEIDTSYGELSDEANCAKDVALSSLRQMLDAKIAEEAKAAEAEAERLIAEEKRKEAKRIADQKKAEADRLAEIERLALSVEREALRKEKEALEAQKAELKRQQDDLDAQHDVETACLPGGWEGLPPTRTAMLADIHNHLEHATDEQVANVLIFCAETIPLSTKARALT